jgi:hypothetical protein
MTREEINSATPEQLNLKTLEALGIELVETESDEGTIRIGEAILVKEHLAYRNIGKELCITNGGVWNPAEDIRDAWKLVDFIHKDGDYLSLEYQIGVFPEISKLGWIAKFRCSEVYAVGETAPEAICKAFLLAIQPGN